MSQQAQAKDTTNLILQRSVGGENSGFREVIKDPEHTFQVIGVIRQGFITELGRNYPVFHLYDLKGQLLATERDRTYLEEKTTIDLRHQLRKTAIEKWREDELAKAREETPANQPAKEKPKTTNKTPRER